MADEQPKSRPKAPPKPDARKASVYGGQWGGGGKPGGAGTGEVDRPQPISTPKESTGTPDPDNSASTGD